MSAVLPEVQTTAALAAVPPSWTEIASAVAAITAAVAGLVAAFAALGTLLATAAAVAIAVLAARYAKGQVEGARAQLEEARALRREQAQPYVVLYAESSAVDPALVDLVVRNFGATAAFTVIPHLTPGLRRSDLRGGVKDVAMPHVIPILAPGQEYRTVWDSGFHRKSLDLPGEHTGTVTYRDSDHRNYTSPVVLDWDNLMDKTWMEVFGAHHGAAALREINQTLKSWTEGAYGLKVVHRDAEALDAREREAMQEWEAGIEALEKQQGEQA